MRDDELDAALSALMAIEPRQDLAGRVAFAIARADEASRPGRWWRRPTVVGAVPAAAVVVLAVLSWHATRRLELPAASAAPALVVSEALAPRGVPEGVSMALAQRGAPRVPPRAAEAPWPHRLPALDPSEPLSIAPIARTSLAAPRLGIEPLAIAQLEIPSLGR